jgi:CheY-like chemotaxis protein
VVNGRSEATIAVVSDEEEETPRQSSMRADVGDKSVVPIERAQAGASSGRGGAVSLQPLVLVVEDEGDTRRSVRQCLEEEGYCVEEATHGRAALERLERGPRPALILLDLMMPVMSGQTLLSELEARPDLASVPVVVMTASGVDEATSALKVPMLRKPVDFAALLRVVEQYSPRFWDEEEVTTEEMPIVSEVPGNETPRQMCAVCGQAVETRCARCSAPLCRACLAAGLAGVCARCMLRWER